MKKIHIIGSIGSDKTTLAKKLSLESGIPYFELDNVVWKRLISGDIKQSSNDRDEKLNDIIELNHWIVEGVHHKWVAKSFEEADTILFLDTKLSVRRFRIIKRFILQKFGCESSNYKPTLKILKALYSYNTFFEHKSKPEIFRVLNLYNYKLVIIKNKKELKNFLRKIKYTSRMKEEK